MADDLDEEWWLNEPNDHKDVGDNESDKEGQSLGENNRSDQRLGIKSTRKKRPQSPVQRKTSAQSSKKRKTDDSATVLSDEKQKRKKRKKKSEQLDEKGDTGPEAQDLVRALDQHFHGKLSVVEQDDLTLEASDHFVACNSDRLPPSQYLASVIVDWQRQVKAAEKTPGSPLLLIVCPAALRAAEMRRLIENFKGKKCKVAKLFAKHMKLAEQVKFLERTAIHLAVGTPNRIQALIENNSLKLDQLKHIILDWCWGDVKLRRMIDIPEIRTDLFSLLKKHLIPRAKSARTKIGLL